MIISWPHFAVTFLLVPVMLLFFYGAGILLEVVAKRGTLFTLFSFELVFRRLLTGLFLVVSVYALLITKGHTILLPVPVLLWLYLYYTDTGRSIYTTSQWSFTTIMLYLLFAFLIYWGFYAFQFVSFDPSMIAYVKNDAVYYGRLADWLNSSGVENTSLDYLQLTKPLPEPYHYGDIWITAILQRLSNLPSATLCILVTYPLMAILFLTGLAAVVSKHGSRSLLFLLLIAGFAKGFGFLYLYSFFGGYTATTMLINTPKLFLTGAILLSAWPALQAKNFAALILLAAIAGLQNVILLVVLLPVVLIFLLYGLLKKQTGLRTLGPSLVVVILSGAYWLFFYRPFYSIPDAGYTVEATVPPLSKTAIIVFMILRQAGPLLPFLVLFFISEKSSRRYKHLPAALLQPAVIFMILLCLSGASLWLVFYYTSYDAIQFMETVFAPVGAISITLIVMRAFLSGHKSWQSAAIILFGLSLGTGLWRASESSYLSKQQVVAVKQLVQQDPDSYFVNLRPANSFATDYEYNTLFSQPLYFLNYSRRTYFNVSLNTPYARASTASDFAGTNTGFLRTAPFSLYVAARDATLPPDRHILDFVQHYKIGFISIADTSLPAVLQSLVLDSAVIQNDRQWKIYRLRR